MKETSGVTEETRRMARAIDEAAFGASIRALQAALDRAQNGESDQTPRVHDGDHSAMNPVARVRRKPAGTTAEGARLKPPAGSIGGFRP
jgi:hypothetical protein